jgi:transposase-like protein
MENHDKILKEFEKEFKNCNNLNDLLGKDGAIQNLLKNTVEQMLEEERTAHLGYEKHVKNDTENARNGSSKKTLRSDFGEIEIQIPRDRNGEFEPTIIKKHEKDIGVLDEKIISMYARGMSVRDIQSHIEEIYGVDVSPSFISNVTDKIHSLVKEWQNRPLEKVYTIVYLDAIHFKVRDNGKVKNKACYTVLGVKVSGHKDLLGMWIGEREGANFWLSVLNDLRNRGVEDILIVSIDGLKGFPEAIARTFPDAEIQLCIIHQIRNSLKYVGSKYQKEFMKDLKLIYQSPTLDGAKYELENLEKKWGEKYPLVTNSWKNKWENLSTYFEYPEEIRRLIYTTNIVEGLHRQFRKVTKTKSIFPHDDALVKVLYLAYTNISKKWTHPLRNWALIISQLSIRFEGRIDVNL